MTMVSPRDTEGLKDTPKASAETNTPNPEGKGHERPKVGQVEALVRIDSAGKKRKGAKGTVQRIVKKTKKETHTLEERISILNSYAKRRKPEEEKEYDMIVNNMFDFFNKVMNGDTSPQLRMNLIDEGIVFFLDFKLDFAVAFFDLEALRPFMGVPEDISMLPSSEYVKDTITGGVKEFLNFERLQRYSSKPICKFIQRIYYMAYKNNSDGRPYTTKTNYQKKYPQYVFGIPLRSISRLWLRDGSRNSNKTATRVVKKIQVMLPGFPVEFIQPAVINPYNPNGSRTSRRIYPVWIIPFLVKAHKDMFPEKIHDNVLTICNNLKNEFRYLCENCQTRGLSCQFWKQYKTYTIALDFYQNTVKDNTQIISADAKLASRCIEETIVRINAVENKVKTNTSALEVICEDRELSMKDLQEVKTAIQQLQDKMEKQQAEFSEKMQQMQNTLGKNQSQTKDDTQMENETLKTAVEQLSEENTQLLKDVREKEHSRFVEPTLAKVQEELERCKEQVQRLEQENKQYKDVLLQMSLERIDSRIRAQSSNRNANKNTTPIVL